MMEENKKYITSEEQSKELLEILNDSTSDIYEDEGHIDIIEHEWFGMDIDKLRWSFIGLLEVLPEKIWSEREEYNLVISKSGVSYEPCKYPMESYGIVFNTGQTIIDNMVSCVKFVYKTDWIEFDESYNKFRKKQ